MLASDSTLRLTEVFCSLQGESSWVGERTVFVRLTGCPLRCTYCDTAYAFHGGDIVTIDEVLRQVKKHAAKYVCVTGGEPLAQPNCAHLLRHLCDLGFNVSLETSGAIDIASVDSRVKRIVDLKTPSSGEQQKNLMANMQHLSTRDEVKFVIGDRQDYDWSKATLAQYSLHDTVAHVLFSPVFPLEPNAEAFNYRDLADWIVADNLPVRMQLQQHKLIWGDQPGY